MIAYIKGALTVVNPQSVVLECGGLGLLAHVSPATISRLPPKGQEACLHTHFLVKEDGWALYGFLSTEELQYFQILIGISGVGPKVASAILSVLSPEQIVSAVLHEDAAAFSKAPGVGKKMAQRIALELQGKIDATGSSTQVTQALAAASTEKQEALEALLALGYGRSEGLKAMLEVAAEGMQTQEIIKLALRKLV